MPRPTAPKYRITLIRPARLFGLIRPLVMTTNANPSAQSAADGMLDMYAALCGTRYRPRRGDTAVLTRNGVGLAVLDPLRTPLIRDAVARNAPAPSLYGKALWLVAKAREANPTQLAAAVRRGAA